MSANDHDDDHDDGVWRKKMKKSQIWSKKTKFETFKPHKVLLRAKVALLMQYVYIIDPLAWGLFE